jgi:hypothetical protein
VWVAQSIKRMEPCAEAVVHCECDQIKTNHIFHLLVPASSGRATCNLPLLGTHTPDFDSSELLATETREQRKKEEEARANL